MGKLEGKTSLGISKHISVGNIKMDLREVGCEGYGMDSSWLRVGTGGGNL